MRLRLARSRNQRLSIITLVPRMRFDEAVDVVFAAYDSDPASPEIGAGDPLAFYLDVFSPVRSLARPSSATF